MADMPDPRLEILERQLSTLIVIFAEYRPAVCLRAAQHREQTAYVVPHEEHVVARAVGCNEGIALGLRKKGQGRDGCPVVNLGEMRAISDEGGIVRRRYPSLRTEVAVVLANDYSWRNTIDRFPNPVVIAVDVDGQQSNVPRDSRFCQEAVYVFGGDERLLGLQIGRPINCIPFDEIDVARAPVDHEARPLIVGQQKARIRFLIILDTEFNEQLALDGNVPNQILNDSVLAPLREDPEFPILHGRAGCRTLPRFYAADRLLKLVDPGREFEVASQYSSEALNEQDLRFPAGDGARGNSADHRKIRDAFRDDRVGGHYGVAADRHTRKNRGADPYPATILQRDFADEAIALAFDGYIGGIKKIMVRIADEDAIADHHVLADVHAPPRVDLHEPADICTIPDDQRRFPRMAIVLGVEPGVLAKHHVGTDLDQMGRNEFCMAADYRVRAATGKRAARPPRVAPAEHPVHELDCAVGEPHCVAARGSPFPSAAGYERNDAGTLLRTVALVICTPFSLIEPLKSIPTQSSNPSGQGSKDIQLKHCVK